MKKTRSMLALLVCLALLVSLCAVTASAAETVSSNVNFTALAAVADAGDATKAVMEGMGLIVPDGSVWQITDHFYKLATPKDGYAPTRYIQTLEAGEGKVLAADATLELAYALAALSETGAEYDVGWVTVSVSTDGENFTEVWADENGQGKENTNEVFAIPQITLTGTAGATKIWVEVAVERHAGPGGGAIGWSNLSASARAENEVSHTADFTTQTPAEPGAASNAIMEAMGLILPEGSNWWITDHFSPCAVPKDGYAPTFYIQTLEAGNGKVFSEDLTMDLSYALAAEADDPAYSVGWLVVYVSTDGENYEEVWYNDEGQGKMYDISAFAQDKFALTGTAGASKVWVKVELERHGGETSGLIKTSTVSGLTKAAENKPVVNPDPSNPKDGDTISVFVALAMVAAAGAVITSKKFRKDEF